ncbi:MAG: hypothetical protein V3U92_00795 [Cellulophaga sp.]
MNKIFKTTIMLSLVLTFSCNGQKKEMPATMQTVMTTHDEVMGQMPELVKLVSKLQTKMNKDASVEKEPYTIAIADLKKANTSMSNWMSNFGRRFNADEMMKGKKLTEQKIKWLAEEDVKVGALKEQINKSMESAKALLK